MNKVLALADLPKMLDSNRFCLKAAGGNPKVVLAHGCFDVLHLGHVRHLQAARSLGSLLVVTVTPDRYVNKGPGRPLFSGGERAEMLASLSCVDWVAINDDATAYWPIIHLRPALFVKGWEYRGQSTPMLEKEREALRVVNGELAFLDTPAVHTTALLATLLRACPSREARQLEKGRDRSES